MDPLKFGVVEGDGKNLFEMMMMVSVFAEWLTDERRLRLISSRDHCLGFSPSQIPDTPRAGVTGNKGQTRNSED